MTTNIICKLIIALVTNVISADNSFQYPDYSNVQLTNPLTFAQLRSHPTEKYATTNVEEVTTIEWTYPAPGSHEISRKLISSVTAILKLKEQWEAAGVKTNDVTPPSNFIVMTNYGGFIPLTR